MHACVKKGAKVCKCGFTYIGHMAEIHTLHFKYWFFDDPFSTLIGFLLTPSVHVLVSFSTKINFSTEGVKKKTNTVLVFC